jgi:hypothetical protein
MRPMGDEFSDFVSNRSRATRVQRNGQTITFGSHPGKQVVMRLRVEGLILAAVRAGKETRQVIRERREFPKGLSFIQQMTRE